MKIDARQSDIETFGDVKEFKTGIDPKNLEFITTLLSSNLYSSPELKSKSDWSLFYKAKFLVVKLPLVLILELKVIHQF